MNNITISIELTRAALRTWREISPDAVHCTALDAAELVLDRLPASVNDEVRTLIGTHGYVKIRNAIARVL